MGENPTFLNTEQVLKIIGIDFNTLWRWRKAGTFPTPIRISRKTLRWREDEILAWMESHRVQEGAAR
ncbi:AlpA family phage regulatory protein [Aliigemmobacter aestuarii]|uniref:AlpA family phage regulatory protein n=1 Tax=Aliigemmobacter aestuarii TaxID=1445661 RepID=A0A4S3MKC8_9RHOB|nr:helix-turn-helix domain-containing protein [Gemmobacter aestuarii]THD82416.1 AlpA family phage regulatory protein [Gemmobacter aestuarii]